MTPEIEQAAADCRTAFAGIEVGSIVQHCHHGQWLESLTEPAENRIRFIIANKSQSEQAERLRRFRPFDRQQEADANWQEAYANWQEAYANWQEAYANRQKAYTNRQEAYANWQKADANWQEADANWQEAYANWQKADANWWKADANWWKACNSAATIRLHAKVCGCPWDATHDIFGDRR